MINFPKNLKASKQNVIDSLAYAKAGSFRTLIYPIQGHQCELAMIDAMSNDYTIIQATNIEDKTEHWDLKIDGRYVDVKTTAGKHATISVSLYNILGDGKKRIFPYYLAIDTVYILIGVINETYILNHRISSNYGGYYIPVDMIKNKNLQ